MRQWKNLSRELDEQIQTCFDAGLTDVRVSGQRSEFTGKINGWSPTVGATGTDPADGQSHRIVMQTDKYGFIPADSPDDEGAGYDAGYAVGDFEPCEEARGWISDYFGDDEAERAYQLGGFLTLEVFLKEVASPDYWRKVFALVYDLSLAADHAMEEELNRFRSAALEAVVDRATTTAAHQLSAGAAIERAWEGFREAVARRIPHAGFMVIEAEYLGDVWLAFGHNRGKPDEVLYCSRGVGLSLNGIYTHAGDYEAVIEKAYDDPGTRAEAKLAACDLIAIWEAIHDVLRAERHQADQLAYLHETPLRTDIYLGVPGSEERLEASHSSDPWVEIFWQTIHRMASYLEHATASRS